MKIAKRILARPVLKVPGLAVGLGTKWANVAQYKKNQGRPV